MNMHVDNTLHKIHFHLLCSSLIVFYCCFLTEIIFILNLLLKSPKIIYPVSIFPMAVSEHDPVPYRPRNGDTAYDPDNFLTG